MDMKLTEAQKKRTMEKMEQSIKLYKQRGWTEDAEITKGYFESVIYGIYDLDVILEDSLDKEMHIEKLNQKIQKDRLFEHKLFAVLDNLNEQIRIYQNFIIKEGHEQEFVDSVTEDIRIHKELFPEENDEWDFTADEKVIEDIKNLVEEAI